MSLEMPQSEDGGEVSEYKGPVIIYRLGEG